MREIVSRSDAESLRAARLLAKQVGATAVSQLSHNSSAEVVWICVPDDLIATVAEEIAGRGKWKSKIVLHSSGALGSDVLLPLKNAGAFAASAHPLMSFVRGAKPDFSGVPFALEGDTKATTIAGAIVRSLGAKPFRIERARKAAYHAFGFFSSPLLVALIAAAQQVAGLAGLTEREALELMEPIIRRSIDNCFRQSPSEAFSGPLRRGDIETIRKHLNVLSQRPELLAVYRALSGIALRELPVGNRKDLARTLESED
jgi:predicted short-subunit dehydrogenase-like oxidoreductase (DUF2520 family)